MPKIFQMRWIIALLSYVVTRSFWGGLFGWIIGSFIENIGTNKNPSSKKSTTFNTHRANYFSADFELNLLSLCAFVIKADGRTTQQELDYVRSKFVAMYGRERANEVFRSFNNIIKHQNISVEQISAHIYIRTQYATRLQIIHFLFEIAQIDGYISDIEHTQILRIARNFRISSQDFESIKAMFIQTQDNAYKILEINPDASDAEVKKAYREMAKKYHPDRVVTQDDAIKKGAEEKFKKVQQAYERIQKERGL